MNTKYILGVKVNFDMTMTQVLSKVEKYISSRSFHYICTTNPEFIIDAQQDNDFKEVINNSDLSLPDGSGILFAKKYLCQTELLSSSFYPLKAFIKGISLGVNHLRGKASIGQTLTGVALMDKMCELAHQKGYSIFLLGGWPKDSWGRSLKGEHNLANAAEKKVLAKYPNLNVVGATSEFSHAPSDDSATVNYIKKCMKEKDVGQIDMIFVAYGHKNQENWLLRNAPKIPAEVGVGVGGTFDYIVGTQKAPPKIIIENNLEWLYRLFTQPWRFRRIFKAFPLFPVAVFLDSVKTK